jgi:hypothetical protein
MAEPPFVPAEAGTQALLQKLGSRFRGNERSMFQRKANTLLLDISAARRFLKLPEIATESQ